MIPTLKYVPGKGIIINEKEICWHSERLLVRNLLGSIYFASDGALDLNEYNDVGDNLSITYRRDIYENYCDGNNYFFLNYDKDNLLESIEIHHGICIIIENLKLSFDMSLQNAVSILKKISNYNRELSPGEHFFTDLNLIVANGETLGGNGNDLAYFYCSHNVDHIDSK